MKKLLLSTSLLLLSIFVLADSLVKLDSLQQRLTINKGIDKAKTYIKLSEASRDISFPDCINYGLKAISIAKKAGSYNVIGLAYKSMGVSCFYTGDKPRALDYYKKGLENFKKAKNPEGMSDCFNNIGLLFEDWSRFDSAYYFYQKSMAIETLLNNKKGMALSLINLGNINYYRRDFKQALDHFYRAMLFFKEAGDADGEAKAFNNLSIIYWKWNKPQKALKYLHKAETIYLHNNGYRGLSRIYLNSAEIYSKVFKRYKKAMEYYQKSLKLKKKLDDKEGIALLYNDIGSLYGNMGDITNANIYFQKSLQIYHRLNSEKGMSLVFYNMGKILLSEKSYRKAISYLKKSLKLEKEIGYNEISNDIYRGLFRSYVGIGAVDSFNLYFGLYSNNMDSLNEKLQMEQILEIEAKYKVSQLVKQNRTIQEENKKKEKNLTRYRLIITGIVGVIILLLFTYVLLVRVRKEENEPND